MGITHIQNQVSFTSAPSTEAPEKTVAQTGSTAGKRVIFVDMEELHIEGERKTAGFLLADARRVGRFNRLFDLNKSFLPLLVKTGSEKGLK